MSTDTMPTTMEVSLPELETRTEESQVATSGRNWYFAFFFISGFCSILYELIWLRLAMAEFGVTTAMVSIVLSSFMAGLGIGSWAAGHLVRKYARRLTSPPLHLYAMAELFIGCSAVVVPMELMIGRLVLEHLGQQPVPIVIRLLRGRWYLVGLQSGSVVRVHGRNHSPGHVCHP